MPARRFPFRVSGTAILLAAAVEALPAQNGATLLVERFDTVVPPALPAGWVSSRNRNALQNDFVSTASVAQSVPNSLLSMNATLSQDLISPPVGFSGRTPGSLTFSLRRSSTHGSGLLVEASTNGGVDFGVVLSDTIRASGETSYETTRLQLPAFLRELPDVYFRWRTVAAGAGTSGTLRIDDIVITAEIAHDVAVVGVRYQQAAARESTMVSVSVLIAGVGTERTEIAHIVLGVDSDGNGSLAGGEIWSRAALSSSPAAGETTAVALEFLVPAAGEYRLVVFADSPTDQAEGNNTLVVPFVAGYRLRAAVVNEIMYAPAGDEPEWIELLNTGCSDIALGQWKIGDAVSPQGKQISPEPLSLPAGGIVVVTRSSALGALRPGCGAGYIEMGSLPSLNNSGDVILLRDRAGCTIDSVPYTPDWGGGSGRSLERRDGWRAGDDAGNWGSSADSTGATPCVVNSIAVLDTDLALTSCGGGTIIAGEPAVLRATVRNVGRAAVVGESIESAEVRSDGPNGEQDVRIARQVIDAPLGRGDSIEARLLWQLPPGGLRHLRFRVTAAGDGRVSNDTLGTWVLAGYRDPFLRISEIMAVPQKGGAEYVEIQNAGTTAVDIAGWTIGGPGGTGEQAKRFLLSVSSLVLAPGTFFVLASDSSLFGRFAICDSHRVSVAGTTSLGLNNDADVVVLRDGSGRSVDSVAFSSRWQSPVLTDPVGRSLERISAALPSSDSRSWGTCVAAAGGTPGCPNSIRGSGSPGGSLVSAHPNPFSPDGDGHDDYAMIDYETPRATGWMSLRIFDIRGRLIRFLANNEPCGARGTVVWDGLDDGRRQVRIGVYIILLEVVGEDRGTVLTARGSVVVAGRLR